jgi:hypothetical protein
MTTMGDEDEGHVSMAHEWQMEHEIHDEEMCGIIITGGWVCRYAPSGNSKDGPEIPLLF